ncbi:MAG: hypothetical protein JXO22_03955 [Phycisphaerae bacterium]|nr:hypothetical protein [Phycisphaerae bacterium]
MLAIVVLGLSVPALMFQLSAAIEAQTRSAIHLSLVQLADELMSEIFADRTDATRGYDYITEANYRPEDDLAGFDGYERHTTVVEVSGTDFATPQAESGIKRFRVEVRGPDGASLVVESFVTDSAAGA